MSEDKNSKDLALARNGIGQSNGHGHVTPTSAPPGIPITSYEALEDLLQPRGPSLKDFFTLLKKRRNIVAITAGTMFLAGCLYAFLAPDLYTATAILEIRGYSPVLGQAPLETLLQNDTRKILYQTTTVAKLNHLSLADEVLSRDGLGEAVKTYFKKRRSMKSRVVDSVVKFFTGAKSDSELDPDHRFQYRETFLKSYFKLLDINTIHETSLVQVRATTTNRDLSQRIANSHAEGLIRHLTDEQRSELGSRLNTLRTHADELQKKLSGAETEIASYAQGHQLVDLSDGEGNLMVSRLTELTKLLSEAQAKRVRAESKVGSVDNRKSGDSSLLDDETVKDLRTKLKDAESEYSALSRLVTGEYPKLVELRGRIDSLRKTVHEERGVNLAALKTEYESNLAAEKMLVQQFKEELNKAHEMSTQLIQYNLLQRDATLLRDLTQSVLKALNETEISASSVNSNVFVSDYAPLPRIPSAPRRNIIVVFSLMLGLVAGVALAVLREVIDSTIRVSDDAQAALGLPTLGIIPSFKALGATNLMESEEGLRGKIAGLLPYIRRLPNLPRLPFLKRDDHGPTSNADETYDASSEQDSDESMIYPSISSEDPIVRDEIESVKESQPAEAHTTLNGTVPVFPTMPPGMLALPEAGVLDALRTLRANILFSSTQNVSRVIMVASGREREGKTSVISNLAVTFARASQKTLLIDGDLRRPKIARRFGIPAENFGLVDFLAGQADLEEILVPSAVSNLMVIPAGSSTLNPTELLGSEKMVALIAVLRERFDVILLDAAPVLPVADALILAQHAETVIFVVRSGRTEKAVAQEAVRRLRRVGARVRGLVLNDFDPGAGDYSSDRYSVSHYTVIDATSIPVAQNGAAPGGFTPDDSRRAVG